MLVRTRRGGSPNGGRRSWLLIKLPDSAATREDVTLTKPRSALTNRLLAEIARDEGGDVERAAAGDPPAETRRLPGGSRSRPRRRMPSAGTSGA